MSEEKDPVTMENLLRDYGNSELRKIVRQAQRLLAMNQILQQCLPENLRPHCQVGQISATDLTILVDSAAWLTHLRFFKPQLIQQLKKQPQCAYIKDVQYRIQPEQPLDRVKPELKIMRQISAENKEILQSTAELVDSLILKKALIKLSS